MMRTSLRKSLKRLSRKDHSNEIVSYKGVSLQWLCHEFWEKDVLKGDDGVELFIVVQEGKWNGATVRKCGREKGGLVVVSMPYVKERMRFAEGDLREKARKDWSIEDVCEYVILPQTKEKKEFFLNRLDKKNVGKLYAGTFVSQARKSKFGDLMEALWSHFKDPGKEIVWLDIFSANQPLLTGVDGQSARIQQKRYEMLTNGLHRALKEFDNRVIFFNSWSDPLPLGRAWCVWEIYGTIKNGRTMDVVYAAEEKRKFVEALLNDDIYSVLSKLDCRHAVCFNEDDLRMIRDQVNKNLENGFTTLNGMILQQMREWLLSNTRQIVEEKRNTTPAMEFATLLSTVGNTLIVQGKFDDALPYLLEAKALLETLGNELMLGILHGVLSDHALAKGDLKAAERHLTRAKELIPENTIAFANIAEKMGSVYKLKGDFEGALEQYELALRIGKTKGAEATSLFNAKLLLKIAFIYSQQGKYEKTLALTENSTNLQEAVHGETHPIIIENLKQMSEIYFQMGEYEQALATLKRAERMTEEQLGDKNDTFADVKNLIGGVLIGLGRMDEAKKNLEQSIQIYRILGREEDSSIVYPLVNLGILLAANGNAKAAEGYYRQGLAVLRKYFDGKDHPLLIKAHFNLGQALIEMQRFPEALSELKSALSCIETSYGPELMMNHPETAKVLVSMASVQTNDGAFDQAMETLQRAQNIIETRFGGDGKEGHHPDMALVANNMAVIQIQQGKLLDALKNLEKAIHIIENVFGPRYFQLLRPLLSAANVARQVNQLDDAHVFWERANQIMQELYGDKPHPLKAQLFNTKGNLLRASEEWDESLVQFENALEVMKTHSLMNSLDAVIIIINLTEIYGLKGEFDRGLEIAQNMLVSYPFEAKSHPQRLRLVAMIGKLYQGKGDFGNALKMYEIIETDCSNDILLLGMTAHQKGVIRFAQHDSLTARTDLERARSMFEQAIEAGIDAKGMLSETLILYALVLSTLGERDTSMSYLHEALELAQTAFPDPENAMSGAALFHIGVMLGDSGDNEMALVHLEDALRIRRKVLGERHLYIAQTLVFMGKLFVNMLLFDKANESFGKALDVIASNFGEVSAMVADNAFEIAAIYIAAEQVDLARPYLFRCYQIRQETLGEAHPATNLPYFQYLFGFQ